MRYHARLFASIFVPAILTSGLPAVRASSPPQVMVDRQIVAFSGQSAVSQGGRILVPLRGVLEKLGASVEFDGPTQAVRALRNGRQIELKIGARSATVNGQRVALDVPAQVLHGTTLVPLRFVAQALGADVAYDTPTNTVNITPRPEGFPAPAAGGTAAAPPVATITPPATAPKSRNPPPAATVFKGEFLEFTQNGDIYTLKMVDGSTIDVAVGVPVLYDNQAVTLDDLRSGDALTISVDPTTHRGTRILIAVEQ
jgi:hypothetical protein